MPPINEINYDRRLPDAFRSVLDVSRGVYDNVTVVHKVGRNEAVTTTIVPVSLGGTYRTPSTLTSLEIVSSDAADTAAGAGARSVTVTGLTTDWAQVTETVAMNGITPVALTNQYYRVFTLDVQTSGTYGSVTTPSHVGILTLREAGAGPTWDIINDVTIFPKSQSQIAAYTIPPGFVGFVKSVWIHVEAAKPCNIYLFKREDADVVSAPYAPLQIIQEWDSVDGSKAYEGTTPIGPFPALTDIGFMAKAAVATAAVAVGFEIYLVAQ